MTDERAINNNRSDHKRFVYSFEEVACFFYIIMTLLTGLAIAHGDSTLFSLAARKVYLYLIFACLVISLLLIFTSKRTISPIILIPIIYYAISTFHSNIEVNGNILFAACYDALRLIGFLLLTRESQLRIFSCLKKFLVVMSIIGILCYFSYVFSFPLPHMTVNYYTGGNSAQYINYYYASFLFKESGALRLCGLFNEPGMLGTVLALVLCADSFNLRKKENLVLFIAGCLSLSVAFLIILVLFLILKSRNNPKIMIPLLSIFLIVLFVIPNINTDNIYLSAFANRLSFDHGFLSVDNRSSSFIDQSLKNMLESNQFLFGYGNNYLTVIGYTSGASTYKTALIYYGILGFSIIYGLPIFAALKRSKGNQTATVLTMCFAMSIYQRPSIYALIYFVLLFGGIEYCLDNKK